MQIISKYKTVLLLAAVALITLSVYGGNFYNGFGYYDDYQEIVMNPLVNPAQTPITNLFKLNAFHFYAPLKHLTNYLLNVVSYNNPHLQHLLNDIIHTLNAMLCFLCILLFTKRYRIAFLTALAFAVAPACSAAVNEIAARGHILSAFFVLCSTYFYLLAGAKGAKFSQSVHFKTASLIFFIFGLLTWPTIILMPLLFLSINLFYGKKNIKELIPFFACAAGACALNFYISYLNGALDNAGTAFNNDLLFSPFLFKGAFFYKFPLILAKYIIYCFYPPEADIIYSPFLPNFWAFKTYYILNFTALVALAAVYYKTIKTNKINAVFLAFSVCFLLPGLAFMYRTEVLSLRYIYLPSIGIFATAFIFIDGITVNARPFLKRAVYIALALWLLLSGVNTYIRKYYWANPHTMLASLTYSTGIAEVWGWFLKVNWESSIEKKLEYMQTAKNILETKYHTGYETSYPLIMQNLDGRIEAAKIMLAKNKTQN